MAEDAAWHGDDGDRLKLEARGQVVSEFLRRLKKNTTRMQQQTRPQQQRFLSSGGGGRPCLAHSAEQDGFFFLCENERLAAWLWSFRPSSVQHEANALPPGRPSKRGRVSFSSGFGGVVFGI